MKKLFVLCVALTALLVVAGCQQQPATFTSTLELTDYQKTTLDEASSIIGETVPVPTYLPKVYEVQEVYIKDTKDSAQWIVVLLISDEEIVWENNEFQCKMRMTIQWDSAGGIKSVRPEPVTIGESKGQIFRRADHNDLMWNIFRKPSGALRQVVHEVRLSASKSIPKRELVKVAESVQW